MGDKTYHPSYHGLPNHDFSSRALSMTEQTDPHSLDTTPAMHYRPSMSLAPTQPSVGAIKSGQHGLDTAGPMHYQNPVTMWHHVPSQSSNLAAMSMMPQGQQHSAAALSMMLQSQGLRYYHAPVKMFPSALQQTQSAQFYHASIACSKRFSEEEKQKLEKVFTDETQKPSTSRKRQLAEELGCPVPKVNNWFQNRRAREKQMHRVQEYEARQAADKAASQNAGAEVEEDEDEDGTVSSDNDNMSGLNQPSKSSPDHFSETDIPSGHEDSSMDCSSDGHDSNDSTTNCLAGGCKTEEGDEVEQVLKMEQRDSPQAQMSRPIVSLPATTMKDHQGVLSSSPETYIDSQDLDTLQSQFMSGYSSLGEMPGLEALNSEVRHSEYLPPSTSYLAQRTPTITTNMMGHDEMQDDSTRRTSEISGFSGFGSLSPDAFSQPSPVFNETDLDGSQGSPNASIASRRKIRPPQRLNQTALRNYPNGPKTGIENTRRGEMFGTIRRAASANGPLSGKILKPGPPVSPMSPRSLDPNILEQLARTSSLNATTATFKDSSSVSPVVPTFEQRYLSADNSGLSIQQRSSSLSLSRLEEAMTFSPNTSEHAREASLNGARNSSFQQFQHAKFLLDTGCGNVTPDEALTTPGLSQFGSELEFPISLSAPRYVESEPTTPSHVPVSLPRQGFPTLKVETPPQTEMFPWSRSPDQLPIWNGTLSHLGEPQSQTFQFQPNITPQNFNPPTGA